MLHMRIKNVFTIIVVFLICSCSISNRIDYSCIDRNPIHTVSFSTDCDISMDAVSPSGHSVILDSESSVSSYSSEATSIDNDINEEEDNNDYGSDEIVPTDSLHFLLNEKLATLDEYRSQSDDYELFLYFTDPHLANCGGYDFQEITDDWLAFLKQAFILSGASFAICGGDILNCNDSKEEACYKLSCFNHYMNSLFSNYHFVLGNHDTNYQGDAYMSSFDYHESILSQETVNDILFNGHKSYYSFSINSTSFYVFDSGIDWEDGVLTPYKKDQIKWFSNELLIDKSEHKVLFFHIPLNCFYGKTSLTFELDKIIKAFNKRSVYVLDGVAIDYSSATGYISFSEGGHFHRDLNGFSLGDIPLVITTTFGYLETSPQPTFDFVLVDYSNQALHCIRVGDGEDRVFNIAADGY